MFNIILIINYIDINKINRIIRLFSETCILAVHRADRISHCVILQQKAATLMQNAELEPRFQGSAQQLFTVGVAVVWGGGFRACAQLRARTATYRVLVLAARISTRVQSMKMFLRLIILWNRRKNIPIAVKHCLGCCLSNQYLCNAKGSNVPGYEKYHIAAMGHRRGDLLLTTYVG